MKIRVHPAFVMYLALIGLIDGFAASISLLLTLLLHEAGHLAVGHFCSETYERIELTPLGGMISYRAGSASCKGFKGVFVACAGPLCNGAAVYLLRSTPAVRLFPREQIQTLMMMNLSMLLINMLPALPLDGGRAIFSVLYYLFPVTVLTKLLTALGCICGGLCIMAAIYGLTQWGRINITLLACGLYMIFCAQQQRESIYASTLHTAIQERLASRKETEKASIIRVNGQAPLSSVIPVLCREDSCIFMIDRDGKMKILSERNLLTQLLIAPRQTFDDAFPDES